MRPLDRDQRPSNVLAERNSLRFVAQNIKQMMSTRLYRKNGEPLGMLSKARIEAAFVAQT